MWFKSRFRAVTSGVGGAARLGQNATMIDHRSLALPAISLVFVAALGACPSAESPQPASPTAAMTSGPATAKLHAAILGTARTERERDRDGQRHPEETLAFFGLRDDMRVVELWPGGGYYTAILAPVLAAKGQLTVTHFDPKGDPKSEDTEEAQAILGRLAKSPDVFGKVTPKELKRPELVLGPDGSADMVVTFRNIHNWIDDGTADQVFAASARVLKSGGVFGVEEHRGKPGMTVQQMKDSGYVPEDVVIALAEKAGLHLSARAEINANPKDTTDHPKGVWALPPVLANKDVDRDKYLAIGESDRMTLKFVKP
jgi:predicted methyltransferase